MGLCCDYFAQTCRELKIPECRSRLHPEDKFQIVNELKASGKKVLMLGDGINDTTALAGIVGDICILDGCC